MDGCFGTVCGGCGVVLVRGPVIAAVVPPSGGSSALGGLSSTGARVLPLLRLAFGCRGATAVYGVATVDGRGRVADRVVIGAVGWSAGARLSIREDSGLIVLVADERGVFAVTGQGHLRLPAGVRRWCALGAGDRVLLVAEPEQDVVVVYPPAALDAMVRRFRGGAS